MTSNTTTNSVVQPDTLNKMIKDARPTDPSSQTFSVRSWGEIHDLDLPPITYFWGNVFTLHQLQSMFGQGGLGKTRMALNMARNQVLQIPFCGMATGSRPLCHLMLSSENNIHRLKHDIRCQSHGLSKEQIELLNTNVHLSTLENPDDGFISLGAIENHIRWQATIERVNPDVLWVDPWGDVQAGEANSDSDCRQSIMDLMRIARRKNPEIGVVVLHHARTGAKSIREAIGFDAANFGKNSKSLYSSCRSVLNLAPGDESENPPIVIVNAKNNNARRFEPFAVRLDASTMTYDVDPSFQFDKWTDSLHAAIRGKNRPTATTVSDEDIISIVSDKAVRVTAFMAEERKLGLGRDPARATKDRLLDSGALVIWRTPKFPVESFIGTPQSISTFKTQWKNPSFEGMK